MRGRTFLFNDTLITFYLRLCGVRYMAKDHSVSKRETHFYHYMGYSFQLAARLLLYMHHPTDRIAHTTAMVTPVVEVAQCVGLIRRPSAS